MKRSILLFTCLVVLHVSSLAQEMSMEEAMKLAEPGAPHKLLSALQGNYNIVFKYWMMPGQEPVSSTGTAESKMIIGGRFLEFKSSFDMMGQTVEALQIYGYDNRINKHTLYAFDTFGTYAVDAAGDYNEETGIITYSGTDSLSVSGMHLNYKFMLYTAEENGYRVDVLFEGPDGNFTKSVEVLMTKK